MTKTKCYIQVFKTKHLALYSLKGFMFFYHFGGACGKCSRFYSWQSKGMHVMFIGNCKVVAGMSVVSPWLDWWSPSLFSTDRFPSLEEQRGNLFKGAVCFYNPLPSSPRVLALNSHPQLAGKHFQMCREQSSLHSSLAKDSTNWS